MTMAFVSPVSAIRHLLTDYVDFDGRSGRSQYWWSLLGLSLVGGLFYLWMRSRQMVISVTAIFAADILLVALLLTSALLAVPFASLHVRRYRDAGMSPWLLLMTVFLPFVLLYLEMGNVLVDGIAFGLLAVNLLICALPSKYHSLFAG
jgi:uncharacterized membrane protein YhaH (DUF805 family)